MIDPGRGDHRHPHPGQFGRRLMATTSSFLPLISTPIRLHDSESGIFFSPATHTIIMSAMRSKYGNSMPSTDMYELERRVDRQVVQRFRGTDADNMNMEVLGRVQETRRNFTFITSE